jgi:hypothetical protein
VLITDAQKLLSNRGFNLMLQAPDFYHAAAVLIQSKLKWADRNKLFEEIIEKGDTVVAFKDKLRLLNMDFYMNHRLYTDGFIKGKEEQIKHLIPSAIKAEELEKICRDFDFESDKINEYLACLEVDEKYRGLPAFEWQQTQTKE